MVFPDPGKRVRYSKCITESNTENIENAMGKQDSKMNRTKGERETIGLEDGSVFGNNAFNGSEGLSEIGAAQDH